MNALLIHILVCPQNITPENPLNIHWMTGASRDPPISWEYLQSYKECGVVFITIRLGAPLAPNFHIPIYICNVDGWFLF